MGDAKLFELNLKNAMLFLDKCYLNKVKVLVHCKAGKSRSVSIVLAWAIGRFHWKLSDLLPILHHRRNGLTGKKKRKKKRRNGKYICFFFVHFLFIFCSFFEF